MLRNRSERRDVDGPERSTVCRQSTPVHVAHCGPAVRHPLLERFWLQAWSPARLRIRAPTFESRAPPRRGTPRWLRPRRLWAGAPLPGVLAKLDFGGSPTGERWLLLAEHVLALQRVAVAVAWLPPPSVTPAAASMPRSPLRFALFRVSVVAGLSTSMPSSSAPKAPLRSTRLPVAVASTRIPSSPVRSTSLSRTTLSSAVPVASGSNRPSRGCRSTRRRRRRCLGTGCGRHCRAGFRSR